MLKRLRRLNDYSPRERLLLIQLVAFAIFIVACLRRVSLNRLVKLISLTAGHRFFRHLPLRHARQERRRLVALADAAARFARGEDRCLVRSLLLLWLLKARQEPAELIIGVAKDASNFDSHAWIESRGRVIGDSAATIGRFANMFRL